MPNLRNAKKALRQSLKRAEISKTIKANIRDLSRHARIAMSENDKAKAEETIQKIIKAVDKAAKNNILKKNTAARKKSRLMQKFNAIFSGDTKETAKK